MALEKVVQSIRDEGRKAADARLDEAKREAAAILGDAEKQAAAIKARREQELVRAVESLKLREVAAAELEGKKLRLNAQKDALSEVRKAVLGRLAELPTEKRVEHVRSLAANSSVQNGNLLVASRDLEAAKKAGLNVVGTVDSLGGVVVVSQDGATREDLTYETLVGEVWTTSLNDVAEALFGKSK